MAEPDTSLAVESMPAPTTLPETVVELEVEPDLEADSATSSGIAAQPTPASLPEPVVELELEPEVEF